MTLHPLTKLIWNDVGLHKETVERIIQSWAKDQAEWLKKECNEYKAGNNPHAVCSFANTRIDDAFQLTPETLEHKFHAIRLKHDGNYSSPADFWDAVLKEFAVVAEEHFGRPPLTKTVNCSVQQVLQSDGTY